MNRQKLINILIFVIALMLSVFIRASANSSDYSLPEGVQVFEVAGETFILWPDGTHEQVCACDSVEEVECFLPENTPFPQETRVVPTNTSEPTNTPVDPTDSPDPTDVPNPTKTPKAKCNKGEGNGGEGCDPGNNPDKGNDDED